MAFCVVFENFLIEVKLSNHVTYSVFKVVSVLCAANRSSVLPNPVVAGIGNGRPGFLPPI